MGNGGAEKEILELIPRENSWEQIIYQVVAMNSIRIAIWTSMEIGSS